MRVENGVKVDAARCSAVTASQLAWLSTDWQPFAAFAKACAVKHGTAQLFLISVWVDDYEAKLAKDAPAPKYPKPVIASVDGKILGRLPLVFPRDPPKSSEVTFGKWADGLPREIRVDVEDPALGGNRTLWLDWDVHANSFVQVKKKQ